MSRSGEHIDKYEKLAQTIGIEALVAVLPVSIERIHRALDLGDDHLNGIPLHMWDRATGYNERTVGLMSLAPKEKCSHCGQAIRPKAGGRWYQDRGAWAPPWDRTKKLHLSAADRCCVLKHVAIHHTNYQPKEETIIG